MTGALDPIQEHLPFELPPADSVPPPAEPTNQPEPTVKPTTAEVSAGTGEPAWRRPSAPLPPSLYEQALTRLRRLPWERWRREATPLIQKSATQFGTAVQQGAVQAGNVLRLAVARGAPYTARLARATATSSLPRTLLLLAARGIHAVGLPAVVLRTAVQATIAYREGLAVEEVVLFRMDDPAGYTVYEAPGNLGLAAAIAYVPALLLLLLAIVCLWPALTPRTVLHLPVTWVTAMSIWLGLGFGAHALPSYEEAGPLAEQARVAAGKADPAGVILLIPTMVVALLTRFGGVLPAIVGAAAVYWIAGALHP
jgi:hypothetical protein